MIADNGGDSQDQPEQAPAVHLVSMSRPT